LGEIYWGTAAASLPINLESDIGLPNIILLGELYWGPLEKLFVRLQRTVLMTAIGTQARTVLSRSHVCAD
jgi:hypothetical protein